MTSPKLFMLLLGCKPPGRHTEQHDVFFGIGYTLRDLLPEIHAFWPEANYKIHIDSWREVTGVNEHAVQVMPRTEISENTPAVVKLFFINLGGYKPDDLEEYHYKMLVACADKGQAVQQAKQTAFYMHTGFSGAVSHIDDKYGVDVDDIYEISDILPERLKKEFGIVLTPTSDRKVDELHIGYLKLDKL